MITKKVKAAIIERRYETRLVEAETEEELLYASNFFDGKLIKKEEYNTDIIEMNIVE